MRQERKIRDIRDGETFFLSEKARTPYVSRRGYDTALGMGGYDERWPYVEYWRKDGKGKREKDFGFFVPVWVEVQE